MNYNVKSIETFEKQAKRLIKKYASLKIELLELVHELKQNPELGTSLDVIVTKYASPLYPKEKAKVAEQELSQTL